MATAGLDAVKFAPRRVLLSLVLLLTGGIGYLTSEVIRLRFDRMNAVETSLYKASQIIGDQGQRISALEVRVAAVDGRQDRIEAKVDKVLDKVDVLIRRNR